MAGKRLSMLDIPSTVTPEMAALGAGTKYKLRECRSQRAVAFLVDDREVMRNASYGDTTERAQLRYDLSDSMLLALYRDYRDACERGDYAR